MKAFLHIIFLIGFLVAMVALSSCEQKVPKKSSTPVDANTNTNIPTKVVTTPNPEWIKQFTSDSLSLEQLEAFEQRGMQKLQDYANYYNLISDKNIDKVFRKQAREQAVKLFLNPDKKVEERINANSTFKFMKIKKLLNKIDHNKLRLEVNISEYEATSRLEKVDVNLFIGAISFKQITTGYDKDSLVYSNIAQKRAEILLRKTNEEDLNGVWKIHLGDIELED